MHSARLTLQSRVLTFGRSLIDGELEMRAFARLRIASLAPFVALDRRGQFVRLNPSSPLRRVIECCYKTLLMLRWHMARTITQRELRNDSAAVLREVQAGNTMIVTRNGTPVAELRPIPPRRFVPRAVIADAAARAPRIDATRFRTDLDDVVDVSVDA